jgi:hypothetical protein
VVNEAPRGAPGHALRHEDLLEKFTSNATLSLSAERAARLAAAVDTLEEAPDVRAVTAELRAAQA